MNTPEGLSILIPVYNENVCTLVAELSRQAEALNIPFQIYCLDDFSDPKWKEINKQSEIIPGVIYEELPSNIGRSKIRNLLSAKARFPYLLFLDCDCAIPSSYFLANYWSERKRPAVVGGRIYDPAAPEQSFKLHWTVGSQREVMDARHRNISPYKSFMFNNVFIQKPIFQKILLDETINTYGHEDTKFGYLLEKEKIPVFHISNPTCHTGLDDTEAFLKKTKQGIVNLKKLTDDGYARDTRLFKVVNLLNIFFGKNLYLFLYKIFVKKKVEMNLRSSHPSLFYFDLFKLEILARLYP